MTPKYPQQYHNKTNFTTSPIKYNTRLYSRMLPFRPKQSDIPIPNREAIHGTATMCTETIAFCDKCGFHRHMHYHLCASWIWSYREIKWGFRTPLDSIPNPRDCPHLDGEAKTEILPGRCPNVQCPGHAVKAQQDTENDANGTADTRTKVEKIEAERIKLGFRRFRPQAFTDPLEVGRPHQRKLPVVMLNFKPEEGSGWGRVRGSAGVSAAGSAAGSASGSTQAEVHPGARPIPRPSTSTHTSAEDVRPPVRRRREFNGPMMMPH